MTLLLAVLCVPAAGDTVVLRDQAKVSGRYVRLSDLLDPERTGDAVRAQAAEIYLGRAPEDGQSRVVTVAEIRRELERRGVDPEAFTFVGTQVQVIRSGASPLDALCRTIAFEIKRHLLEQNPGARADETVVRILSLHPEEVAPDCEVAEIRPRSASDYLVTLVDPSKRKLEVEVVARILRTREIAFAVREINSGKVIERADLDLRRVETADQENATGDLGTLVGATAQVRIRKGARLSLSDLRLKAIVKRGDIVRACSSNFEVDARALEDGAPFQEIALEYVTSKNRLRAKVAACDRVDVVEGGK
ncbi:MAG TPA: flagellar basal body P-ring formation chaperone FlgA [Planctomycetota bacterium]|nr:flagellar basal body P-ring formation chaperone FlgA [Planctomycetota bacterium]